MGVVEWEKDRKKERKQARFEFCLSSHKSTRVRITSFFEERTLTEDAATGLLVNQIFALIAAQCILCSAQAAVQTIRRNVQRNTRFHL